MKILLVGAYPPPYGGVQIHLKNLRAFLEERGHRCFIINMGKKKDMRSESLVSPKTAAGVAYYLLKKRDHIFHMHIGGALHFRLLMLVLVGCIIFEDRCAFTIHSGGLPTWGKPGMIRSALIKLCFSECRAIICVNRKIADFFKSFGLDEDRISVVSPFGFRKIKTSSRMPDRVSSFMTGGKKLLCNIGLLEAEYCLDFLLRVFKRFSLQNPDWGLIMIGSGSLEGKLRAAVSSMGLDENVLMTGDLDYAHAMSVLAASHCYVRTTLYDGDCLSLREALHLGIPSIATDVCSRPDGTILFPAGDEERLYELLMNLPREITTGGKSVQTEVVTPLEQVERILLELSKTGKDKGKITNRRDSDQSTAQKRSAQPVFRPRS